MKTLKNHQANVLDVKARAKEFGHQFKLTTLAGAMTLLIAQSSTSYASDIEVYVSGANSQGSTTIMFLLDISGSMDTRSIEQDYGAICNRDRYGGVVFEGNSTSGQYCTASGREITTQIQKECVPSGSGYKCYDRISRLRQGMLAVLEGDSAKGVTRLSDDLVIGLSTLGAYTTTYHEAGAVKVPARALNETVSGTSKTQREILIEEVKKLRGQTNTPTTRSYAEVVAYLMGKTTQITGGEWYFGGGYGGRNIYSECLSMSGTGTCLTWGQVYYGSVPSGFTRGASKTVGGYPGYVYTANNAYSGFGYSSDLTKNTGKTAYAAPTTISRQISYTDDQKKCSGQGVYVLTDGVPNYGNGASGLIRKALGNKGAGFECTDSGAGWNCTLNLASALLDSTKNPANISFKTAVVGFGSDFNTIPSSIQTEAGVDALTGISDDIKQAAKWGIRGKGGWYSGSNADDVVESIEDFVDKNSGEIPSISTGSSTIPVDALNPESIQAFSYFPQFEPKVADNDKQQLWFGNLKKYYVVNNGVYASKAGTESSLVVKKSVLQDLKDMWGDNISYPTKTPTFEKWGALSKLPLGTQQDGNSYTGRKLLTDYEFNEAASGTEKVAQNLQLVRITHQYTTDEKTKTDNPERIKGLMALLGYNIASASENLEGAPASLRQMGSILHSLPVLLTQSGKAVAAKDESGNVYIDTTDRKDYVLFGTTQGLLHVVDAKTGVEKFSFLPKEMAEKQYELFKSGAGTWDKGKNALYYGVDGEWAAHTVYVSKDDGTLTVDGAVRNVAGGLENEKENLQGKQWVYGGLRMGGRSYYALDLTGLDDSSSSSPKIKFHIDPASSSVKRLGYDEDGNPVVITKEYAALAKMGQSWSKPKLDYVNWNGERKLVMFVGGGYDAGGDDGDGLYGANGVRTGYAGYEKYNYEQDNEIGAGVYMFDADNGELLWYASKTEASGSVEHTEHDDLQYSVVSEIKTVDRNNDGVVDHLYFGDLAGQAFRVDLHQPQSDGSFEFVPQITRILNLHKTNGTSPRFYYPPVFTAHHSAGGTEGGNIVVASFLSGNKSSPLLATNDSPTTTGTTSSSGLEFDGVYALYEYDIHPTGTYYPASSRADKTIAAAGEGISLDKLMPLSVLVNSKTATTNRGAAISPTSGWGGWYYKFEHKFESTTGAAKTEGAGVIKGLTPLVAMEGNLYVTMFDAAEAGTTSACGAGVKGQSFTQRLCLPTGVCPELANYKYNLGSGIVSLNVGPMSEPTGGRGIVIPDNDPDNVKCEGEDCAEPGKRFIPAGGPLKFIPHRWYERYSVKE
ncbi:hypothetical protein [Acinetobacter indicus]|uniref:hypothetical protein n=1 Tax=Acinetobacter indicus TaxID=756892 RepID=UPI0014439A34|nr:hypothetical protein [Acinetobacter indicus]